MRKNDQKLERIGPIRERGIEIQQKLDSIRKFLVYTLTGLNLKL